MDLYKGKEYGDNLEEDMQELLKEQPCLQERRRHEKLRIVLLIWYIRGVGHNLAAFPDSLIIFYTNKVVPGKYQQAYRIPWKKKKNLKENVFWILNAGRNIWNVLFTGKIFPESEKLWERATDVHVHQFHLKFPHKPYLSHMLPLSVKSGTKRTSYFPPW